MARARGTEVGQEPETQQEFGAPATAPEGANSNNGAAAPTVKQRAVSSILDQLFAEARLVQRGDTAVKRVVETAERVLGEQIRLLQHDPRVLRLEGSWRGLDRLVSRTVTGNHLKIEVFPVTLQEVQDDLDHPAGFEHSQLYRRVYETRLNTPDGEPMGALVGDFAFDGTADHLGILAGVSKVAAKAFCPFLAGAAPALVGMQSWAELSSPRAVSKLDRVDNLDRAEFAKWRAFRETEESRFVALALPRVLARTPYGASSKPVREFPYEEAPLTDEGEALPLGHDQYCWMNAAWVLAERLTESFDKYRWCTAIFGPEAGGRVRDLAQFQFLNQKTSQTEVQCPSEVVLSFKKEGKLSDMGFIPLLHHRGKDSSSFWSSQTVRKPQVNERDEEFTSNEEISATLAYQMARCRLMHHLVLYAQKLVGKTLTPKQIADRLNTWLKRFILAAEPTEETCNEYPLEAGEVIVKAVLGRPGWYTVELRVVPWIKLKGVAASVALRATVQGKKV